jgi:hypothetical protein
VTSVSSVINGLLNSVSDRIPCPSGEGTLRRLCSARAHAVTGSNL